MKKSSKTSKKPTEFIGLAVLQTGSELLVAVNIADGSRRVLTYLNGVTDYIVQGLREGRRFTLSRPEELAQISVRDFDVIAGTFQQEGLEYQGRGVPPQIGVPYKGEAMTRYDELDFSRKSVLGKMVRRAVSAIKPRPRIDF